MRIANDTLIQQTVDLSTSWSSDAIYLGQVANYSIQLVFVGNLEGSFKLQCSNDAGRPSSGRPYTSNQVENWTNISGSTQVVDEEGNHTWDVENTGHAWVRVTWSPTAASATLTSARFTLKGV